MINLGKCLTCSAIQLSKIQFIKVSLNSHLCIKVPDKTKFCFFSFPFHVKILTAIFSKLKGFQMEQLT